MSTSTLVLQAPGSLIWHDLTLCREELEAKLQPLQDDMDKLQKLLDNAYKTLQDRNEQTADAQAQLQSQCDKAWLARSVLSSSLHNSCIA